MSNFRHAHYDGAGVNVDDPSSPAGTTQIPLKADKIMEASDDGLVYNVTTALTVTYPAGLSPRPNTAFVPPPSGNLSIAVSGGANVNGGTTTVTRSRASNPGGIVVTPYAESDGYGASGA